MVSEYAGATWHQDERYKVAWKECYDCMVNHYVEKVKYYGDKFLESPAGILFQERLKQIRGGKKTAPNLDVSAIREFEGAEGIAWTSAQAYDIFSILSEVTTTSEAIASVSVGDHTMLI